MMRMVLGLLAILMTAPPALAQVVAGNGGVAVTTNQTVSTLTTGTVLGATAAVSADGRYVTIGMHPSFSSLEGIQTFDFGGNSVAGGNPGLSRFLAKVPFRPAVVGNVTFVETDKKLLAVEVPAMTLKEASLKEASQKLADVSKGNIVLGIRGLEQAGIDVSAKKTYVIEKGTLKDALLAALKTAAPQTDMVISAEDNVVEVATQAQADHDVVTKTYYLDDLLANLPRIISKDTDLNTLTKDSKDSKDRKSDAAAGGKVLAEAEIPPGPRGVLPPAGAGTPPVAAPEKPVAAAGTSNTAFVVQAEQSAKPAPKPAASYSTSITELITSTVRPEIWKVNGGTIGEIAVVGDRVTVKAPASVQAILEGPSHHNPDAAPIYVGYGGQ
jgi:hypothetical protein